MPCDQAASWGALNGPWLCRGGPDKQQLRCRAHSRRCGGSGRGGCSGGRQRLLPPPPQVRSCLWRCPCTSCWGQPSTAACMPAHASSRLSHHECCPRANRLPAPGAQAGPATPVCRRRKERQAKEAAGSKLHQMSLTASASSLALHGRADSATLRADRARAVFDAFAQDQSEVQPGADLGRYEHSSRTTGACQAGGQARCRAGRRGLALQRAAAGGCLARAGAGGRLPAAAPWRGPSAQANLPTCPARAGDAMALWDASLGARQSPRLSPSSSFSSGGQGQGMGQQLLARGSGPGRPPHDPAAGSSLPLALSGGGGSSSRSPLGRWAAVMCLFQQAPQHTALRRAKSSLQCAAVTPAQPATSPSAPAARASSACLQHAGSHWPVLAAGLAATCLLAAGVLQSERPPRAQTSPSCCPPCPGTTGRSGRRTSSSTGVPTDRTGSWAQAPLARHACTPCAA